jgi:Fe2+ transport system protein FeoA
MVSLGKSVLIVKKNAFKECSNLSSLGFEPGCAVQILEDGSFHGTGIRVVNESPWSLVTFSTAFDRGYTITRVAR